MLSPIRRLWYHKQASGSAHISTRWQRRCETSMTQPPPSAHICGKHAPLARGSPRSHINSVTATSCCLRALSTRAGHPSPSTSGDASASLRRFIVCSSLCVRLVWWPRHRSSLCPRPQCHSGCLVMAHIWITYWGWLPPPARSISSLPRACCRR